MSLLVFQSFGSFEYSALLSLLGLLALLGLLCGLGLLSLFSLFCIRNVNVEDFQNHHTMVSIFFCLVTP